LEQPFDFASFDAPVLEQPAGDRDQGRAMRLEQRPTNPFRFGRFDAGRLAKLRETQEVPRTMTWAEIGERAGAGESETSGAASEYVDALSFRLSAWRTGGRFAEEIGELIPVKAATGCRALEPAKCREASTDRPAKLRWAQVPTGISLTRHPVAVGEIGRDRSQGLEFAHRIFLRANFFGRSLRTA
jgi:hypothetical protein